VGSYFCPWFCAFGGFEFSLGRTKNIEAEFFFGSALFENKSVQMHAQAVARKLNREVSSAVIFSGKPMSVFFDRLHKKRGISEAFCLKITRAKTSPTSRSTRPHNTLRPSGKVCGRRVSSTLCV